jgi:drug/metabolite transporter (DMT)-like permease
MWTIFVVVGCTLLMAVAQVLLKQGLRGGTGILNPFLIAGFLLYGVAALLLTFSLKHGELSVLYPVIALGFIWVSAAGVLFFGEAYGSRQLLGTIVIFLGVSVIGHSARRRK